MFLPSAVVVLAKDVRPARRGRTFPATAGQRYFAFTNKPTARSPICFVEHMGDYAVWGHMFAATLMPLVFPGVERRSANIFFSVARDGHDVVSQQRGGTSRSKNCSKNRTQSGDTGLRRSSNRESDTFGTSQSPVPVDLRCGRSRSISFACFIFWTCARAGRSLSPRSRP